ncbi:efflux RND transporter periplasmic adaptor subunit [Dysgonomonas sp. ZJ279]|uniref:efflux RND transporter periplasmic adaptor subunit n=1 Tax=Dysgonomonas sp. ZJ279 TaxID=2709796 RepID=UPI0013EBC010|nr:efflux RND transporter periplasmic adaptor subunit [Dysgonomonas sp. ZJ279]
MKFKKIVFGATALMVMVSCGNKQANMGQQAEATEYPTMVLSKEEATLESVYPVTIKGAEDIEIRPRIDGFIDAIYVDEGSVVRKGQALFRINSPQAEQALKSAKAAITSSQASVNTAKLNVDRIRPLADKGIVSKVQLDTYENAYQTAVASMAQAQASLENAQATMSWTNVTSPVDGVVGTIPFRQGSLVNSTNALTTVANTGNVFAYFSLNEKDLMAFLGNTEGKTQVEKIKNLPPVTLVLADGTIYPEKGKIETISGVISVSTGSANFRAEFPNSHGLLRSGSSGKISIPRTLKDVFVIPQKATFAQQDKILVYKVQGDSVVQTIISAIGMPEGKNYAVTAGLNEGERIVSDNVATLRNNMKIKVK